MNLKEQAKRWPWGTKTVAKTEAIIDGVAWFLLEIEIYGDDTSMGNTRSHPEHDG